MFFFLLLLSIWVFGTRKLKVVHIKLILLRWPSRILHSLKTKVHVFVKVAGNEELVDEAASNKLGFHFMRF